MAVDVLSNAEHSLPIILSAWNSSEFPGQVRTALSLSGWCLQQKGSGYGRQSGGTTITCVVCDASGVFLTGSSNNPAVKYRWTVIKGEEKSKHQYTQNKQGRQSL